MSFLQQTLTAVPLKGEGLRAPPQYRSEISAGSRGLNPLRMSRKSYGQIIVPFFDAGPSV